MAICKLVNANLTMNVIASSLIITADYLFPKNYAIWIVFIFPLLIISLKHLSRLNVYSAAALLSVSGILGYFISISDSDEQSELINRIIFLSAVWVTAFIQVQRGREYYSLQKTIKELSEAKKLLEEREENLKEVFENNFDALLLSEPNGRIIRCNPAAEALFGYSEEELCRYGRPALIDESDPELLRVLKERDTRGMFHGELQFKRKNGSTFSGEFSSTLFKCRDGSARCTLIIRDITARKRDEALLEKTLEELKRSNRDLERFASVTSHDLQEPVRVILVYTSLLRKRLKDMLDEKSQQYMDFIIDSSMRMNDLIKGLLLYSRVSSKAEELIETDLNSVFQDVLRDLHLQITESKAFLKSDKLPVVKANPLHMNQLFLNLISNAIKFRGITDPRIFIQAKENETEWLLSIRDNGIGIGEEYLEKIFVVFNRLHSQGEKYPGNGIGLSICKKIISNLGGRIWVESQPGEGATFYFTIPKEVFTV